MGERIEVRISEAEHSRQLFVQRATPSDPYLRFDAEPEPGSLTAARLRLADAAEAYFRAQGDERGEWDVMVQASFDLALLRTKRAGG